MKRDKRIINTSIKGIITNIFLVMFKSVIGFLANSTAIILDALNNLSDVLSSVATIIGIKLSNKEADKEHPYGHGRIEYFTTIIVAIIILAAGVTALIESTDKIINPITPSYTVYTIIIVVAATVTKIVLGTYVKKQGKLLDSDTLIASGNDAIFDSLLSFSTLVGAIIFMIFNLNLDGYIGLVIASFIIKSSIEMIRDPINDIIGKRINDDFKIKIIKEIQSYDDVKGVFDLIVHNYGPVTIIGSVHIEIDDNMTAKEIHKLCKEIEYQLYKKYDIIMTIGIYASNDSSEDAKKIRREINKIIKGFDNIIQVHGFYIDEKEKRVIFDLIYNYKEKNIDKTNNIIKEKLKEKYSDYKYYINIDKDFG